MGADWYAVCLALAVGGILVGFIALYANGFHVSMLSGPIAAFVTYLILGQRGENR